MSVIKHPRLKKKKSLKKDHRVFAMEGNKSFRGVWRKKKRRLAKKERRVTQLALSGALAPSAPDAEPPKRQAPRKLRKIGVVTLERALEIKNSEPQKRFSQFRYSSRAFQKS